MSTAVVAEPQRSASYAGPVADAAAQRLRGSTVAVRLHIGWPGIRKTLSEPERCRAAGAFDADTKLLSAAKKLLDTRHPAFRAGDSHSHAGHTLLARTNSALC